MDYLANIQHIDLELSKKPVVVNVDAISPVTYPTRTNLRYELEVWAPEFYEGAFQKLTTLEASEEPPITSAGATTYPGANYMIDDLLHGLLESCVPDFALNKIVLCETLVRPYYTKALRKNGATLIDTTTNASSWVYRGGMGERDYVAYKNRFFTEWIGKGRKFLTYKPNYSLIRRNQPEHLAFITNFSPKPAELRLRVEVTYDDDTQAMLTPLTLTSVAAMGVYLVPVGPDVLGLAANVQRYTVWLSNEANERLSEERTYIIYEHPVRKKARYFLFENSLGVFDTLGFDGDASETLKVTRQTAERFRGYDFLPQVAERVVNKVTGEREITVSVGYAKNAPTELRDYWQELVLSEQIFLAGDRGYIPVTLLTDNYLYNDDNERVIARTFTFRCNNKENGYSNLPIAPAAPVRPTGWRGDAPACQLDQSTGLRNGKKRFGLLVKYYLDNGQDVKPRNQKTNVPGTDGYIPEWDSEDCLVTTTPYRSAAYSKSSVYKRNDCANGEVGQGWTINIAALAYGSEISQADADAKAIAAADALDTQANANANGACIIPVNIPIGVTNSSTNQVFAVIIEGVEIITNTSYNTPTIRLAASGLAAGTYNIDVRAMDVAPGVPAYKIRIPSKNLTSGNLLTNQTYRFSNVVVNWGDPDIVIIGEPA